MNNTSQIYLLLQSANNNAHLYHGSHLMGALVVAPLVLTMLILSIGLVLDVVFKWEVVFEYMFKAASISLFVAVIGIITVIFIS